jgi:hypothetical protein
MEPKIVVIGEFWFWQIFAIRKAIKDFGGRMGKYTYEIVDGKLTFAEIRYIKVKPFFWRRIYKHELKHHEISSNAATMEEAIKLNDEYDKKTCHGSFFRHFHGSSTMS